MNATGLALLAYAWWGLVPAYWKLLGAFAATELILYRILLSLAFLLPFGWADNRWARVRALVTCRRTLLGLVLSGSLIGFNWFLYVWAIGDHRIVEASLGYFLNPLVNVALGALVLKERMSPGQRVACGFAGAGAVLLTFAAGVFPWVAVLLALSFSAYGLTRKLLGVETVAGTIIETAWLAPLAVVSLFWMYRQGHGHAFTATKAELLILLAAGVVTTVPLLAFAEAAKRLSMSELGFLQFLSPTLQFLLGVFVYAEPFKATQWAAFALIWVGLALFVRDMRLRKRSASPPLAKPLA